VSKATGFVVPPNKAIVGANAFRHESGIHQDGILKERTTYEIMSAEDVGVPAAGGLVLGKHSGRHAFKDRLKSLGITLDETQLDRAFDRFKNLADKKKQVFDEDLVAIIDDETKSVHKTWELKSLMVTSGTNIAPNVEITLLSKGKTYKKQSSGDGPVDACYKAIESVTKRKAKLLEYGIQSVTQGKDALGEVTVKVAVDGKNVIGHGASTDIIEASAKAYINAINKVIAQESVKK
jgi:2-isopropylmalate synthase